jgi:hypothetical protein
MISNRTNCPRTMSESPRLKNPTEPAVSAMFQASVHRSNQGAHEFDGVCSKSPRNLICCSASFQAVPASLGVSATRSYDLNSLAVPRKAKEAIGGITRLTHEDGKREFWKLSVSCKVGLKLERGRCFWA